MSAIAPIRGGLFESLSRLAAGLLAVAQTRLELISVDLSEAQEHLLTILVLGLAAMLTLGIGLLLASLVLVLAFWDTHRLLVLGILAAAYLGVGMTLGLQISRRIRDMPRLFSSSLAELAKDRQQFGAPT